MNERAPSSRRKWLNTLVWSLPLNVMDDGFVYAFVLTPFENGIVTPSKHTNAHTRSLTRLNVLIICECNYESRKMNCCFRGSGTILFRISYSHSLHRLITTGIETGATTDLIMIINWMWFEWNSECTHGFILYCHHGAELNLNLYKKWRKWRRRREEKKCNE